jgi:hypothetical protein
MADGHVSIHCALRAPIAGVLRFPIHNELHITRRSRRCPIENPQSESFTFCAWQTRRAFRHILSQRLSCLLSAEMTVYALSSSVGLTLRNASARRSGGWKLHLLHTSRGRPNEIPQQDVTMGPGRPRNLSGWSGACCLTNLCSAHSRLQGHLQHDIEYGTG